VDINDIRRANLKALKGRMKLKDFAERVGTNPDYLSQILSKNGKRQVGPALARACEVAFGKEHGWMDAAHPPADPPPEAPTTGLDGEWGSYPLELKAQIIATVQAARRLPEDPWHRSPDEGEPHRQMRKSQPIGVYRQKKPAA